MAVGPPPLTEASARTLLRFMYFLRDRESHVILTISKQTGPSRMEPLVPSIFLIAAGKTSCSTAVHHVCLEQNVRREVTIAPTSQSL